MPVPVERHNPITNLFYGLEKILFLPQCQSTNDEAWLALDEGRAGHGTLLYTHHQTTGRGQRGTRWLAAPGENLLCSTLLRTAGLVEPETLFDLSRAASLALAEAVGIFTEGLVTPSLKWPNDLYAGGKKLGGILIENRWSGQGVEWSVIGLGLNVNQTEFAPGLAATSLRTLTGRAWLAEEAAACVQKALEGSLVRLQDPRTLRVAYETALLGLSRRTLFTEPGAAPYEGILLGTTPEGLLRVLSPTGERRYEVKGVAQAISNLP